MPAPKTLGGARRAFGPPRAPLPLPLPAVVENILTFKGFSGFKRGESPVIPQSFSRVFIQAARGPFVDIDPRALAILHEWLKVTGAEMTEARLRMTRISQGRRPYPQQGVGGAWFLDRQCNRDGRRALDHAGDA
jgi:hypothetical protein